VGDALVFVTGASGGIGEALVQTVPWSAARVVGISRSRPAWPERSGSQKVESAPDVEATRHLLILTSGAASSVYPGWAS
jgi:NAD(P)-dependent dehydrogenase (short-subunit alcohol dehydrogenase family)